MSYYTLDFIDQRWVILDPAGAVVSSHLVWQAAQNELTRLNNDKEKS